MTRSRNAAAAVLACGLGGILVGCAAGVAAPLVLEPCQVPGVSGQVRCGSYEVWENRVAQSGRRLRLRVAMLPARGVPKADPLVVLEGGPGVSNVEAARRFQNSSLREERDILLIDARGTGASAPIQCAFQADHDVLGFLRDFLPPAQVQACRDSLMRLADLSQYVTPNVVDDLDEVRRALGIERINLWGSSGGTRQALVWMRRHPTAVRSAMLEGPVPIDARMPLTFAADAQEALDGVLSACMADDDCAAAFPNVRSEFAAVVERLARQPAHVVVKDPTGVTHEIDLTLPAFAQVIRYMLYVPIDARAVPLAVHYAARGDYGEIARRAVERGIPKGISYGFYLSNTCSEDIPFFTNVEAAKHAQGTFLGEYRVRQQQAACAGWPRAALAPDYLEPVRSAVPVLILVGEHDPVTPVRWAQEVAAHLENAVVAVVPGGGHGFADLENVACLDRLRAAFLQRLSVVPDSSCLRMVRRKPFLTARP